MSLGELYQQDVDRSLSTMAAIPPDPPKRDERTAWGAPWRAIKAAAADVLGSTADVLKGYGAASAMTLEADPVARAVLGDKAVQQGAAEGRRQIATGEALVSDVGQSFRQVSKDQRPDPVTASKAEQIVFGVVRPVSKLVAGGVMAGPFGIVGAAGEEGFTQSEDLREQGVDFATRTKIGTLTAGVNAAGAFLPMAGPTLKATAGLYLLGGPGAFMAQQQATRKILEHADYAELAKQYDPLDPTGLALSALIPLPFAAHGAVRNVRAARGSNATARPEAAPPAVAPEVVDAAMTHNLTVQQDVHEAVPPAARAAEVMRGPVTENPNFKAWFGDSKVVDEDGKPLVVYHGTARDFTAFDIGRSGEATGNTGFYGEGVYFTEDADYAAGFGAFARRTEDDAVSVVPAYLSLQNPAYIHVNPKDASLVSLARETVDRLLEIAREEAPPDAVLAKLETYAGEGKFEQFMGTLYSNFGKGSGVTEILKRAGFDGVVVYGNNGGRNFLSEAVAFRPEQVKSAIGNSGRFDPNSASLTDPVQARIDATPTEAATALETREVPVKSITLSEDVPQFKSGANAAGVVEPLGGSFDRTGVAPIQLWERTDGRLEVISGRHRLDLARRSGEETIPAQIHREADGFDVRRAAALDAELNIRDGQGKVRDYVDYFQATGLDRATAEQRGLLARSTGKRAYAIANDGSPELIAAHRAGAVGDEAAVAIAGAAPGDSRLQAVGIRAVQDGKTIAQAANTVRAVKLLAGERADDAAGDLFGFDDSAMREAESMAKIATAKQREVQTRLSAISGAAKRPELAKAEGVNIKDQAAVLRRVEELRAESAAWENWTTNPALVEAIRAELHPDGAPLLQAHSADDLAAKAAREADAPRLDEKAQIDAEREHFQLVQQAVEGREDTTGDMFDAHMRSVADRVASVEKENPAAAQEMAAARALAAEGDDANLGALDADLVRVAAECALSMGST